jgi:hypothetical protein
MIMGLLLASIAFAPSSALAGNVHFKRPMPTLTENGLTATVNGYLAGLGNGDVVVYVTAVGTPAATCTNQGGTQAAGQNPATVSVGGSQTISGSEIKNGTTPFSVTTTAPGPVTWKDAGCPNKNWTAKITGVDFTSFIVTVEQGGVVVLQQTFRA